MVNGKMCSGVIKDELMCRIDPEKHKTDMEKPGCRLIDFTNKPMKGYVLINDTGLKTGQDFDYWIGPALSFNPK
ncbi:MAG: hypothetical protein JWP44_1253 [Mucilaginibacter sp.]|nr:hypothetical protein [Mucilaginibacter sp.]